MRFERVLEPCVEPRFFSVSCSDAIRLACEQAFARGKSNKILRRFDLTLKMLVLGLDVIHCLLRSVRRSIANKGGVRIRDVVEQVLNRVIQRFGPQELSRQRDDNQRNEKMTAALHTY